MVKKEKMKITRELKVKCMMAVESTRVSSGTVANVFSSYRVMERSK